MDPAPVSYSLDGLHAPHWTDLSELFDVPVHTSHGEVDASSITWLSPLALDEIPDGYQRWVEKRQREFRAGRHHARTALDRAGAVSPIVRRGDDGLPLFPAGYHGSITHTGRDLTFAAAAICTAHHAIGLDAENHKELSASMVDAILLPMEQRRFHQTTASAQQAPSSLGLFALWVFSMKEAFYKCIYPHCAAPFGFLDLDVDVEPSRQAFVVTLRSKKYPDVPSQLGGRYAVDHQRIICAVTWPNRA
ncbi:MAG TPA: 4'-phosphopantetheinyl transferase superfamily protein [Polyangiaceae bacterium]|nr:4'-phosphopantetheinyl transferase superfamily protein [Polyangiaceae bacterium]